MGERIALVVDDSRSARFALRKYLEGHAFRVDTADSARSAYAWLQDQRPDLIFLDHVMPGEDGFTALRHLKADPQTATIPVVICSSNEGGAFVAVEALIDDARRTNTFGFFMSLTMLMEFGDAFDFTGAEFADWCREAGFSRVEIIPLVGASSAAVAWK